MERASSSRADSSNRFRGWFLARMDFVYIYGREPAPLPDVQDLRERKAPGLSDRFFLNSETPWQTAFKGRFAEKSRQKSRDWDKSLFVVTARGVFWFPSPLPPFPPPAPAPAAARIVLENGFFKSRNLTQAHIAGDDGFKNLFLKAFFHLFGHLMRQAVSGNQTERSAPTEKPDFSGPARVKFVSA